jgi:hypothetical protein
MTFKLIVTELKTLEINIAVEIEADDAAAAACRAEAAYHCGSYDAALKAAEPQAQTHSCKLGLGHYLPDGTFERFF